MGDFLMQFANSGLGQAGIIFVLATIMDAIKKRMTGSGVFEEVGDMLFKFFKGIGEGIAIVIYGNKVEKQIADILKEVKGIPEDAIEGLIDGLLQNKDQESDED